MQIIRVINLIFLELLALMLVRRGVRILLSRERVRWLFFSDTPAERSGLRIAEGGFSVLLGAVSAAALIHDHLSHSRMASAGFLFGLAGQLGKIKISLTPACFVILLVAAAGLLMELTLKRR